MKAAALWALAAAAFAAPGPQAEAFDPAPSARVLHLAPAGRDDPNAGAAARRLRSIGYAWSRTKYADRSHGCAVRVAGYGGFPATVWYIFACRSGLDARCWCRARLSGFPISGVRTRALGDALPGVAGARVLTNNVLDSRTLTPDDRTPRVWHEDANDGGVFSIYDHSHPGVTANLFIANRTLVANDGAVVLVALWAAPVPANNITAGSHGDSDDGGGMGL